MGTYEITFEAVVRMTVTVSADSVEAATAKAIIEFADRDGDQMPELWPMDFEFKSVEEVD